MVQPPAGRKAGPGFGVPEAGWRVALRLGEGIARIGLAKANSFTGGDWYGPLQPCLHSGQSE